MCAFTDRLCRRLCAFTVEKSPGSQQSVDKSSGRIAGGRPKTALQRRRYSLLADGLFEGPLEARAKQLFFCNLTESDLRSDSPVV